MKQLITITPDGGMTGLQTKPGKGLDLRQFGKAEIHRSSLIEWDEDEQGWFVKVLKVGMYEKPLILTPLAWAEALPDLPTGLKGTNPSLTHPLIFAEYEDAVAAEVEWIQAMRRKYGPNFVR